MRGGPQGHADHLLLQRRVQPVRPVLGRRSWEPAAAAPRRRPSASIDPCASPRGLGRPVGCHRVLPGRCPCPSASESPSASPSGERVPDASTPTPQPVDTCAHGAPDAPPATPAPTIPTPPAADAPRAAQPALDRRGAARPDAASQRSLSEFAPMIRRGRAGGRPAILPLRPRQRHRLSTRRCACRIALPGTRAGPVWPRGSPSLLGVPRPRRGPAAPLVGAASGLTVTTPFPAVVAEPGSTASFKLDDRRAERPHASTSRPTACPSGWTARFRGGGLVVDGAYVDPKVAARPHARRGHPGRHRGRRHDDHASWRRRRAQPTALPLVDPRRGRRGGRGHPHLRTSPSCAARPAPPSRST